MGWRQMVVGAVVGQVAEFLRGHRPRPQASDGAAGDTNGQASTDEPDAAGERAPGGRLNPLNAAEDMLKRVVDHAKYRTDQSVVKAADEFARKTQEKWPAFVSDLEAAGDRVADRVVDRTNTVVTENIVTLDRLLDRHREQAEHQARNLIFIGLGGLAVVGAGLIVLAWALLR